MAIVTSDKLMDFLKKKSFDRLGGGLYSDVFASPHSDRVIKVSTNETLDAWPDYILWATKMGYAGLYAPKVHSIKFGDGFYVASMERLLPIRGDETEPTKCRREWRLHERYFWKRQHNKPITAECPHQGFYAFLKDLYETFGPGLDLHDGNIMYRANGQLVVTDPITQCNHCENVPKRMRAKDLAWARNARFQSQKSYAKA